MKSITERLRNTSILLFAPVFYFLNKKNGKEQILLALSVFFLLGCFKSFYKSESPSTIDSDMITSFQKQRKTIIGHFNNDVVYLENIQSEGTAITARSSGLLGNDINRANAKPGSSKSYKPQKESDILLQVHLYMKENQQSYRTDSTQKLIIPVTDISSVEIYEKDKKRTTTNHILSGIGLAFLVGIIIISIVAATAVTTAPVVVPAAGAGCNCPQVYVQDGNQSSFKSGLYSGAVNSNLERSDYLLLDDFSPLSDSIQLRIENVKGEEQFINRLQLLRVNHQKGTKVLADKYGNIYSYASPVAPLAVRDIADKEYSKALRNYDAETAGFIQPRQANGDSASSLILQFPAEMSGRKARLILRASNTLWSGLLYKEFQGMYGNAYTRMREKQEKMDRSSTKNWVLSQSLPLKVYVENEKGQWQLADYFQTPGNTAWRDMIMELDIPKTTLQTTRIKLETVYRFWDIDYAALDIGEQEGIEIKWLNPTKALLSTGENIADKISLNDKSYLSLKGNNYLDLIFIPSNKESKNSSFFLSGTGYYHQSPISDKKPDVSKLRKFKKPGAFQSFSVEEFEKVNEALAKIMVKDKK